MKAEIRNLYLYGKNQIQIAEWLKCPQALVTKVIYEIREDLRMQKVAEADAKLGQIQHIEMELFKAIAVNPHSNEVKELQNVYQRFLV